MNEPIVGVLLDWLTWWVLLAVVYYAVLSGVDAILAAWQRAKDDRHRHRAELHRIERETAASVQAIASAFVLAQQLVRDEAPNRRGDRR